MRSLLEELRGIDRVGSCKEIFRRNVRYLIVESCKEFVRRMSRYSIGVGSCKENVRRNARYLIELRVVRSLLGSM